MSGLSARRCCGGNHHGILSKLAEGVLPKSIRHAGDARPPAVSRCVFLKPGNSLQEVKMTGLDDSAFMRQSAFAAYRGVSRKTVTKWKSRGLLVLKGDLVDVAASDAALDARPPIYRGGVASSRHGSED